MAKRKLTKKEINQTDEKETKNFFLIVTIAVLALVLLIYFISR